MMRPLLISVALASLGLAAPAQQKPEPCETSPKYESRNQVDPRPLSISTVSGRVIVEAGETRGAAGEGGSVAGACLGLFTEEGHRLVAAAVADDAGRFTFGTVTPGYYRLVVRAGPLCVANVPLRVVRNRHGAGGKTRQVVVHMRAAGYDICSYGDYK